MCVQSKCCEEILLEDYSTIPYGFVVEVNEECDSTFSSPVCDEHGKTFWIERLLSKLDKFISVPIPVVFYLYNGPFHDVFQIIKNHTDLINKNGDKTKVIFINCTGQLPDIHQILSGYGIDRTCPCLFVFDDLMFAVCEDKDKLDML